MIGRHIQPRSVVVFSGSEGFPGTARSPSLFQSLSDPPVLSHRRRNSQKDSPGGLTRWTIDPSELMFCRAVGLSAVGRAISFPDLRSQQQCCAMLAPSEVFVESPHGSSSHPNKSKAPVTLRAHPHQAPPLQWLPSRHSSFSQSCSVRSITP